MGLRIDDLEERDDVDAERGRRHYSDYMIFMRHILYLLARSIITGAY